MTEKPKTPKARQYYKTSKKYMAHEIQIATLNAFAADPELKYFMGVAAGAGIAAIGDLLKPKVTESGAPVDKAAEAYGWMLGVGSPLLGALGAFDFGSNDKSLGSILKLSGGSFAGFCACVLILKSIFGDSDKGPSTLMTALI